MAGRARPVVAFIPPSCCGAGYFDRLRAALAERVEFRAVELPGHGRRYARPVLTRARSAVSDVICQLGRPVHAVYGECLGAYLGLGLAAAIGTGAPPLIAASNAPPSRRAPIPLEHVEDGIDSAVAVLAKVGGELPAEVLADPELRERAYPLIRGDLRLTQGCVDLLRTTEIRGDIHVLAGDEDAAATGLGGWAAHTRGRCEVVHLSGGHLLAAADPHGVAGAILRILEA
ncbi:MAG TPA: alpha/beta fold hydrolase [Trebonia sp.]|jgi:surfactin synthase thioesterase subunit|nr:alpha/beta fold hydrolase [Trebonia sp.]